MSDPSTPLDEPYYNATPAVSFLRFWRKYVVFTGRASRTEYWWIILFQLCVYIIGTYLWTENSTFADHAHPTRFEPGPTFTLGISIVTLWALATLVPTLAVTWRRLHDVNLRGWVFLLTLVPFLGPLLLTVFTLLPPNAQGARFDRRPPAAQG